MPTIPDYPSPISGNSVRVHSVSILGRLGASRTRIHRLGRGRPVRWTTSREDAERNRTVYRQALQAVARTSENRAALLAGLEPAIFAFVSTASEF